MLKLEKTEVVGWEAAIRGMRNPMNSWDQSDSAIVNDGGLENSDIIVEKKGNEYFVVGEKDQKLATGLRNAGTDHRKFMRMIEVYVDITAPLYWWKEFDTYKVGTVANSCSTMHKIAAKEFTLEDFSHEHLGYSCCTENELDNPMNTLEQVIIVLNGCRDKYIATNNEFWWWQMIQLLPSSYNQKRTIMMSYEVLANIYKSRRHHKLDEWHTFCNWIKTLPYSKLITGDADYLNKKITIPEADAIAARTLSKLQNSEPTKDVTITDWWN